MDLSEPPPFPPYCEAESRALYSGDEDDLDLERMKRFYEAEDTLRYAESTQLPSPTPSEAEEHRRNLAARDFWRGEASDTDDNIPDNHSTLICGKLFTAEEARQYSRCFQYIRAVMARTIARIEKYKLENGPNQAQAMKMILDGNADPAMMEIIDAQAIIGQDHISITERLKRLDDSTFFYSIDPSETGAPWRALERLGYGEYYWDRCHFAHRFRDPLIPTDVSYARNATNYQKDMPKFDVVISALNTALQDESIWALERREMDWAHQDTEEIAPWGEDSGSTQDDDWTDDEGMLDWTDDEDMLDWTDDEDMLDETDDEDMLDDNQNVADDQDGYEHEWPGNEQPPAYEEAVMFGDTYEDVELNGRYSTGYLTRFPW